jgi:hypothetical protein
MGTWQTESLKIGYSKSQMRRRKISRSWRSFKFWLWLIVNTHKWWSYKASKCENSRRAAGWVEYCIARREEWEKSSYYTPPEIMEIPAISANENKPKVSLLKIIFKIILYAVIGIGMLILGVLILFFLSVLSQYGVKSWSGAH